MQEINKDIFEFINDTDTDAICITTNGVVNSQGLCMMGAGTAGTASQKWPSIRKNLGEAIKVHGNFPHIIGIISQGSLEFIDPDKWRSSDSKIKCRIFSFPTKHHFMQKANISLIETSSKRMVEFANILNLKKIIIPAMGCGKNTGQLDWETEVKPVVENILDNRFIIAFLEGK